MWYLQIELKPFTAYYLTKNCTIRFGNLEATFEIRQEFVENARWTPIFDDLLPICDGRDLSAGVECVHEKFHEVFTKISILHLNTQTFSRSDWRNEFLIALLFLWQVNSQSAQEGSTNCTVFCGGITKGITEDLMKDTFSKFGTIQDVKVVENEGYAFIKFTTKEAAENAIEVIHNTEINDSIVKCYWGMENGRPIHVNQPRPTYQQVHLNITLNLYQSCSDY